MRSIPVRTMQNFCLFFSYFLSMLTACLFVLIFQLFFFKNIIAHVFYFLSKKTRMNFIHRRARYFYSFIICFVSEADFNNHKHIKEISQNAIGPYLVLWNFINHKTFWASFFFMNPVRIRSPIRLPQRINTYSIDKYIKQTNSLY